MVWTFNLSLEPRRENAGTFSASQLSRYVSMKFISEILFAVLMIVWGYIFYSTGWYSTYDVPVPKFAGILLIFFGIYFSIAVIRKRKWKSVSDYLICKECLTTYVRSELKNHHCPKCEGSLDELNGFYERHPELKSNKKT
jgi:hypothetical protein